MSQFHVPVTDYMTATVHTASPETTLPEADRMLVAHNISSLAITRDDKLLGVVSRTDLLHVGTRQAGSRHKAHLLSLPDKPVSEVMTQEVQTVSPAATLSDAAKIMQKSRLHRVFVTSDDALQGVLSPRDFMAAIADKQLNHPISEYMSAPLFTIRAQEPISTATERLEKAHVTGLVVLDNGWPVGVFTQVEALESRDTERSTPVEQVMSAAFLPLERETPIYRAAAQACAMGVRRIIAVRHGEPVGIVTGLDFAKAIK